MPLEIFWILRHSLLVTITPYVEVPAATNVYTICNPFIMTLGMLGVLLHAVVYGLFILMFVFAFCEKGWFVVGPVFWLFDSFSWAVYRGFVDYNFFW